jgi:apolipoprotein D and lipocalin family protein
MCGAQTFDEKGIEQAMKNAAAIAMIASLAFAIVGCATLSRGPVGNRAVPQPTKSVDLDRYLGRWYEIARYEASFQRGCEAVTADYSRKDDGTIRILNSCRQGSVDGKLRTSTGKAKIADSQTQAKLRVSFFGPFYGDYWVLDHADDYSWSIVGEPSGRYLWLLARDARPDPALRSTLESRAKELGYDWSLVRITKH